MRLHLIALVLLAAGTATAQSAKPPQDITSMSQLQSALGTLTSAAADRILIRDYLGKPLIGSDGAEVGTVQNFAAVPGGNLIAAIVQTSDGGKLAIPYGALKFGSAAGSAPVSVPFAAGELKGMSRLSSLADQLSQ